MLPSRTAARCVRFPPSSWGGGEASSHGAIAATQRYVLTWGVAGTRYGPGPRRPEAQHEDRVWLEGEDVQPGFRLEVDRVLPSGRSVQDGESVVSKQRVRRVNSVGCIIVAIATVAGLMFLLVTQPAVRFAAAVGVAGGLILVLLRELRLRTLMHAFRARHGAEGRDLLIVYSASPHWQAYIEQNWVPRWRERAVLLNRSEPDWQSRPEAKLWRRVAGPLEHTPAAIIVPRRGRPAIVRFFRAFRDHKHGDPATLREREQELENRLAVARERL